MVGGYAEGGGGRSRVTRIELRGTVTSTNITSQHTDRGLVLRKHIGIGNIIIGRLKAGIGNSSTVRIGKALVRHREGGMCCLFCGPHNIVDTIGSSGNHEIIASCFRNRGGQVCPVKHLSCSASNVLVLAGSKRLTGLLVRPHCGISGACITGMRKLIRDSSLGHLHGNIGVGSKRCDTETGTGIVSDSHTGGRSVISLAVRRKEGRRIGGVFRTVKRPMVGLGQRACSFLALGKLASKRCHRLDGRRIGALCRGTEGGDGLGWTTGYTAVGVIGVWSDWSSKRNKGPSQQCDPQLSC